MFSGLSVLRERGAQGCILVGSPQYYIRFGFRNYPDLEIEGVPAEVTLALPLDGPAPHGRVEHHAAFLVGL
jgi:putative acetyltransferase